MLKNKFITMFKFPSLELITRFSSLCLSLVLMLSVFLGSPVHAQADVTANFDTAILSVRATENGAIFSNLIADAAVEPEEAVETPEAKAAAKAEAKKAKAAAKLEAKKLKEAEDAKAEEVKAAAKAAKLEAKKAKEAANLEAKKAKEAEKAAAAEAVEEKEKAETESAAPETATEPELESSPAEVVTP